ncbi:NADPH-dependent FMN reductase [Rurimicrobium arvi]
MKQAIRILAIIGSASKNSSNEQLMTHIQRFAGDHIEWTFIPDLKIFPHFDPEQSATLPPEPVGTMRQQIADADAVVISTPEYVFSIPSGLKNLIEWTVASTVWDQKPCALITASAHGAKGHEELQLLMRTVGARFNAATCLLVHGIRSKMNEAGELSDLQLRQSLSDLMAGLEALIHQSHPIP